MHRRLGRRLVSANGDGGRGAFNLLDRSFGEVEHRIRQSAREPQRPADDGRRPVDTALRATHDRVHPAA